jgi:hypothetical protein
MHPNANRECPMQIIAAPSHRPLEKAYDATVGQIDDIEMSITKRAAASS